jgi:putative phage-type endonuclease
MGASDVATAAGVNPFQTPYELYLTKIGELDPNATIDDAARGRMERGHRLEDVALEWDRDITGDAFRRVNRTWWHPRIPFLYCHPDALRSPFATTRRLVEVKTSGRRWKEVPRHVEVQVMAQMAVTGATSVDVVVLTFDGPPSRFLVERDAELITALEELSVAFWERVQTRVPPPMDGSDGARRWLDSTRWAGEPELRADDNQRKLLADLLALRQRAGILQAEDERLVNVLKFTMAGSGRLNAPGIGRVNWTPPATIKSVAWKEVAAVERRIIERAEEIAPGVVTPILSNEVGTTSLDDVESLYTTEREQRTFRVSSDSE